MSRFSAPTTYAAALVAALTLAACGASTTGGTGAERTPRATSSSSSSAAGRAQLSKHDYIVRADAVCRTVSTTLSATPPPASDTDYAGLARSGKVMLGLFPPFIRQETALAAKSADQAELVAKWLEPDQAGFDATKPAMQDLVVAVARHDEKAAGRATTAMIKAGDTTPDSTTTVDFLKAYGLTDCAALEGS